MTQFNEIVTRNARIWPNRLALVDHHARLNWKEVNQRINSLANALLTLGLLKGDRVAVISPNCHQVVEVGYAMPRSGLIASFLNWRLLPEQLTRQINDLQPKAIIVHSSYQSAINSIRSGLKGIEIFIGLGEEHGYSYDYESLVSEYPSTLPQVEVSEDDVCHIIYTAGTTGWVKGAALTHRNRMIHSIQQAEVCMQGHQQVSLIPSVLFTAGPWYLTVGSVLVGATIVLRGETPEDFVRAIEEDKVTWTTTPEIRFRKVKNYLETSGRQCDFSSLCIMATGGGIDYPPSLLTGISGLFGVVIADKQYAGTEYGSPIYLSAQDIAAGLSPGATEQQKKRLESMGKPGIFGSEVRIVDENGNDVAPGQPGEILVRGDSVMKGYWNNPELTKKAFRGGWYHPNDQAVVDEDGYIYFVGRLDNMIKTGGFNVFPQEVENVISRHEAVRKVAVFGVEDEEWGSAVTAAVELNEGYEVSEQEIKDFCHRYLSGFQSPKTVLFLSELPWAEYKLSIPELKRLARERKEQAQP